MAPFLRSGDRIDWIPAGPETFRRGDVITFVSGGSMVVHRFLGRRGTGAGLQVREKGDAQRVGRWIRGEEVLGRVVRVRRAGAVFDASRWHWRLVNLSLGIAGGLLDWLVEKRSARRHVGVTRRREEHRLP